MPRIDNDISIRVCFEFWNAGDGQYYIYTTRKDLAQQMSKPGIWTVYSFNGRDFAWQFRLRNSLLPFLEQLSNDLTPGTTKSSPVISRRRKRRNLRSMRMQSETLTNGKINSSLTPGLPVEMTGKFSNKTTN